MGFEGFSVGDYALVCDSLDEFVAQSELDVVAITSRIEECRKTISILKEDLSEKQRGIKDAQKRRKVLLSAMADGREVSLSDEEVAVISERKPPSSGDGESCFVLYNGIGRSYKIPLTIGRDIDNALVIPDPMVSRRHARLFFEGGYLFVEDVGSKNGLLVNGKRVPPGGRAIVCDGSVIQIGKSEFSVGGKEGGNIAEPKPSRENPAFFVSGGISSPISSVQTSIGRSSSCGIVIMDKSVSRKHATIIRVNGHYFLRDDGSSNGTFVNGHRVPSGKAAEIFSGDELMLGSVPATVR